MAFEEKAALEVIKPVGGLVGALIGPKIEKLKCWAEKRELKNQLDPEALAKILESYLITLSSRTSTISSICFPQKDFSIERAYEPLFLEEYSNFHSEQRLPISEIVDNLDQSCLIIDSAGMGKSTFSKYLITQILYKSDRIPILFELRRSKPDIDLIESIAKELDPLGKTFSRELFYELVQSGKFIIVLDGFDEVEYERQHEVADQINQMSVKGQQNTLVLTTRPQELIPTVLNGKLYQFSDFSNSQAENLVRRLDDISGLDIGERLIAEFDNVPTDFLKNPLLVSLLYTTFGSNNTIADRICTFYSDIYHALYKGHDLINKNGFEREKYSGLDYEQFRVLLRALCFQMILKRKASFSSPSEAFEYINNAAQLSKVELKSPNGYFNDLLNAVPLLQKEGGDYKFLHKTIIEYFAAEYIVYRSDSESILKKMFTSRSFGAFEQVFNFVYELAVETYDSVVTKYHAEKIVEELDLSSDYKAVMSTAYYMSNLKVGVFSVDDYRDKERLKRSESDEIRIEPGADIIFEQGINTWSWSTFNYEEKEWFLIIGSADRNKSIHSKAWEQLATKNMPLTYDYIADDITAEIAKFVGFNKWIDVNSKFVEELGTNKAAFVMLYEYAEHVFGRHFEKTVLSSAKIQLFLDGIRAQKDIEDELSDLLI